MGWSGQVVYSPAVPLEDSGVLGSVWRLPAYAILPDLLRFVAGLAIPESMFYAALSGGAPGLIGSSISCSVSSGRQDNTAGLPSSQSRPAAEAGLHKFGVSYLASHSEYLSHQRHILSSPSQTFRITIAERIYEQTTSFLMSSVGRKMTWPFPPLLCSFLVHLLLIFLFKSDYAEFDATVISWRLSPLRPIEIVLFLGFLLHAVIGIWLWIMNRRARPVRYKVLKASDSSALSSRIMWVTGCRGGFHSCQCLLHQVPVHTPERSMYEIVRECFES
jgi:hypothetical protein